MVDQQRLQSALRRFASTLVRRYDVGDVLYRLSDTVSDVLGVTGSGVSILDNDVLRFVTATSETVAEVERLQDHFEQGPCRDAAATTTTVVIDDLAAHRERWPKFAPAAVDRGLSAALGIPMHVNGTTVGALNVYDAAPRAWTDEEVTAAQLLADMATAYVVMVGQLRSAEQLAEQLQHALDSRIVIEQAKGALARDHDVDVSAAFELLRRYARNHNRPQPSRRRRRGRRRHTAPVNPRSCRSPWTAGATGQPRPVDERLVTSLSSLVSSCWAAAPVV